MGFQIVIRSQSGAVGLKAETRFWCNTYSCCLNWHNSQRNALFFRLPSEFNRKQKNKGREKKIKEAFSTRNTYSVHAKFSTSFDFRKWFCRLLPICWRRLQQHLSILWQLKHAEFVKPKPEGMLTSRAFIPEFRNFSTLSFPARTDQSANQWGQKMKQIENWKDVDVAKDSSVLTLHKTLWSASMFQQKYQKPLTLGTFFPPFCSTICTISATTRSLVSQPMSKSPISWSL